MLVIQWCSSIPSTGREEGEGGAVILLVTRCWLSCDGLASHPEWDYWKLNATYGALCQEREPKFVCLVRLTGRPLLCASECCLLWSTMAHSLGWRPFGYAWSSFCLIDVSVDLSQGSVLTKYPVSWTSPFSSPDKSDSSELVYSKVRALAMLSFFASFHGHHQYRH